MTSAYASPTEKIIAYAEEGIAWLIFNNPEKRNAISLDMWAALPDILDAFAEDRNIRCIILAGVGEKAFVSGADISQFETERASTDAIANYDKVAARANAALDALSKPVIAMIRGYCIGAGMGIALKCDLRIAADDARFAIPAGRLGLGYRADGMRDLVSTVGSACAKEIFFTARQFSAGEAMQMGLVNRVVAAADLKQQTEELARQVAANAPLTLKAAKMTINAIGRFPVPADRAAAIERSIADCFASEDYREGRQAFVEKRAPRFRGK